MPYNVGTKWDAAGRSAYILESLENSSVARKIVDGLQKCLGSEDNVNKKITKKCAQYIVEHPEYALVAIKSLRGHIQHPSGYILRVMDNILATNLDSELEAISSGKRGYLKKGEMSPGEPAEKAGDRKQVHVSKPAHQERPSTSNSICSSSLSPDKRRRHDSDRDPKRSKYSPEMQPKYKSDLRHKYKPWEETMRLSTDETRSRSPSCHVAISAEEKRFARVQEPTHRRKLSSSSFDGCVTEEESQRKPSKLYSDRLLEVGPDAEKKSIRERLGRRYSPRRSRCEDVNRYADPSRSKTLDSRKMRSDGQRTKQIGTPEKSVTDSGEVNLLHAIRPNIKPKVLELEIWSGWAVEETTILPKQDT